LFATSILKEIGGYYGGFRIGYDTFLMNILPMLGRIAYATQPLYNRVMRSGSLTRASETNMRSELRCATRTKLQSLYAEIYHAYQNPQTDPSSLSRKIRSVVYDRMPSGLQHALLRERQALALQLRPPPATDEQSILGTSETTPILSSSH
jgi:hypothetical protein